MISVRSSPPSGDSSRADLKRPRGERVIAEISQGFDAPGAVSKQMLTTIDRIEARERWLRYAVVVVTVLSVIGIISFGLPRGFSRPESLSALIVNHAVEGLFGLVLVFNIFVLFEQVQVHRIRQQLANRLYELSVQDPLTGLFNRRYMEHRLEEEIARSQRLGSPFTVILFDLDSLKQINDEHGHGTGDDVLKAFAERLKAATRGSDVAARYGGDEFLLLLADCKSDRVHYVLGRLSGLQVEVGKGKLPIACSAGWADCMPGESLASVLKRADAALYANKREHLVIEQSDIMLSSIPTELALVNQVPAGDGGSVQLVAVGPGRNRPASESTATKNVGISNSGG